MTRSLFAVVAVNTTVHAGGTAYADASAQKRSQAHSFPGPVFHYEIPANLSDSIQVGNLIQVPFGPREVQALVVALSGQAPVEQLKSVIKLLYAGPVLTPQQIDLGLWASKRYLCPLIDCLRLMLPPGMLRRPRSVLYLHPQAAIPADLPPLQAKIVELAQERGSLTTNQIRRQLKQSAQSSIRSLVRRGILVRSSSLPAPRARPRRANFCRLCASPPQIEAARPHLGHPSKQAAVLNVLLSLDDPLPQTEAVLDAADASTATLATLIRKKWVAAEPQRTLLLATPASRDADLARAPKQRAVLRHLEQANVPVEENTLRQATEASASVLRTMLERALVQRIDEPSTMFLRLKPERAREAIVELRGAERQHKVLDYLLSRPADQWLWTSWVYAETGCSLRDLRALEAHGLVELAERQLWRDPLADQHFVLETPPTLTPDQEHAWAAIQAALADPRDPPAHALPAFLLHGVTGSGKTEIYLRAAAETLAHGKQVIVLVPEISMTAQTIRRFQSRFSSQVGIVHSQLSDGERYDTWRRVRSGQIRLVVGPRSALFAPFEDLGLIVIDEEHDSSYKQSDIPPAYHAREVAYKIAELHNALLILGSATPDLTTYHRARETAELHLLELPRRILAHRLHLRQQREQHRGIKVQYRPFAPGLDHVFSIDLPPVRVVDMRHELRVGNSSMFSRLLQHEIEQTLAKREQAILFLNRRGASTFVMCRDCGTVIRCPHCDIPMTYHLAGHNLTCHHCNHQRAVPSACPICDGHRIKYFGTGTQRVQEAVQQLLPTARVLRWDRDTTADYRAHDVILERFTRHEADILIGTQMVAKGLDLPLVTLVGVVSADTALNLPDFRASERTFQLLAQVAGRAGRGPSGGQVILQTYTPEHYAIQFAAQHDYRGFYAHERAFRQSMNYPPFAQLVRLVFSDSSQVRCQETAQELARRLAQAIEQHRLNAIDLVGPAPCFFKRRRGRWRWHIIARAPSSAPDLERLFDLVPLAQCWQIDVAPLDIL
jgi:primosomal protein N' (replication factor Y)